MKDDWSFRKCENKKLQQKSSSQLKHKTSDSSLQDGNTKHFNWYLNPVFMNLNGDHKQKTTSKIILSRQPKMLTDQAFVKLMEIKQ